MSYIKYKDLPAVKRAYNKAVKSGDKVFKYHQTDILVSYAKYVIEYLEGMKNAKV